MKNLALYSVGQTRQIEAFLTKEKNIEEYDLICAAGSAVFAEVEQFSKDVPVVVLCGPGNNGGDGYIVAGLACQNGYQVQCFEVGDFKKQSDVAKKAKKFAIDNGVNILKYNGVIIDADMIIIDAILGIGIKGEVRPNHQKLIKEINDSDAFVIAVDNPSGIDCDSGEVLGAAIFADITVTFLSYKKGLFLKYGTSCCGEIKFSNLDCDYDEFLNSLEADSYVLNEDEMSKIIPARNIDSNKGDFGNVLIVGGDHGMGGAVLMAAQSACKTGAGKVTVLTRKDHVAPLMTSLPHVMSFAYEGQENLKDALIGKTLIVIGPGLGQSKWSEELFDFFMKSDLPKIIDADALNLLAKAGAKYDLKNAVITPHPKEAARLLDSDVQEVQQDRRLAIQNINQKYGAITVLKGSNSLIFGGDKLYLCPYSDPAMSVAGMGDILTGIIAGLSTQRITLETAAILGVYMHILSSIEVSDDKGEIGVCPLDVLDGLF